MKLLGKINLGVDSKCIEKGSGEQIRERYRFSKVIIPSNGEQTERWTFSYTAGGCINGYRLSGRQGSPRPSDASVRMGARHPDLQVNTTPSHSVWLGKQS